MIFKKYLAILIFLCTRMSFPLIITPEENTMLALLSATSIPQLGLIKDDTNKVFAQAGLIKSDKIFFLFYNQIYS